MFSQSRKKFLEKRPFFGAFGSEVYFVSRHKEIFENNMSKNDLAIPSSLSPI